MKYYVNKNAQSNGDHEVHKENCNKLPEPSNRIYLGDFSNCLNALKKAQEYYKRVDGCYFCSSECHRS
jgi:hypothetical protein